MNTARALLEAANSAIVVFDSDRKRKFHDPKMAAVQERIRTAADRRLRRAVIVAVPDVDLRLVEDLFKILKTMKGGRTSNDRLPARVELALKLTEMSIGKNKEKPPEHLLWIFNKFYNGVAAAIPEEDTAGTWQGSAR
jgi:hypothetical protein